MQELEECSDFDLVQKALGGNKSALASLIDRYYDFVFNVAIRLVHNRQDALELTQDVMVKVITNLGKYTKDISFKAWLYRVSYNHFLNMKKYPMELSVEGFQQYGNGLDAIEDQHSSMTDSPEMALVVEEIKVSCTTGMLMCLSRAQRLIYVLGDILGIDQHLGATVFETTTANYRKMLSRARQDLHSFMERKCGLVDPKNSCRCQNKTRGFIQLGWVDPNHRTFTKEYLHAVEDVVPSASEHLEQLNPGQSQLIFQQHPYYSAENKDQILNELRLGDIKL